VGFVFVVVVIRVVCVVSLFVYSDCVLCRVIGSFAFVAALCL